MTPSYRRRADVIPEHLKREIEIQRDVITFLETLRCKVATTSEPRAKLTSTRGVFDLFVIFPSRRGSGWFDTKRPGESLTADQVKFGEWLTFAGIPWSCGGVREAREWAAEVGLIARL